jgi:tetratricopeptide (TPR) repeat protein
LVRNTSKISRVVFLSVESIKEFPIIKFMWIRFFVYTEALILIALGINEEAIASYDRALQINPDYHEAFYNKACVYALQSQIELALENLQKAIQLAPEENREMAKTDSAFDNIRSDPRFQELIQ